MRKNSDDKYDSTKHGTLNLQYSVKLRVVETYRGGLLMWSLIMLSVSLFDQIVEVTNTD